jgi:type I restriction enzyme S subunit
MADWQTVSLGDALTFQRGFDITKDEQRDGPYPVISSSGPKTNHAEFKVRGPGVIIGRKGSLGTVFYSDSDYWPHDTTLWIKDFHGNHPRFAYYFLQTMGFERLDAGASNPSLNRNHIHTIPVRFPPLPVQRRIAGILSAYDELMENSQRRIRLLEAMARALYREWFVHFRFPGHEKHPRVASPLGHIPKGWELKKLGEVAETFRGRSYRSADLADEGGLPFLNLKCIDRDGGFRRSGIKRYIGEYKDSHVARKGDIVVAVTDMTQERRLVAHAARVPSLGSDFGVFSMDLVRIETNPPMPKAFLYSFLRYSSFADEVKQHANGANVLHLSPERITDFSFAVPPQALMGRFADFAAASLEQIDTLENQMENLRRTRDLLLPRLLSGQVELKTEAA